MAYINVRIYVDLQDGGLSRASTRNATKVVKDAQQAQVKKIYSY